jgi:7-cyano-7-deazaguanine synthase
VTRPAALGSKELMQTKPRAVVLLSGGMDSATCCYEAAAAGYELYALTVNYGQRSQRELDAALAVAQAVGARHHQVYPLDLTLWGGSALTDPTLEIPTAGVEADTIPVTYVPARNTILLSLALSWAEVLGAQALYIGVNSLDFSGYPDCRPEFVDAFRALIKVATKATTQGATIQIETPLQFMSKLDIVHRALELGVPLELTWSCYQDGPDPCGVCDSCRLRDEAIEQARRGPGNLL